MLLIKGEISPITVRLETTISSPFYLFVFTANNSDVKFTFTSDDNASQIEGVQQFLITTDTYFDFAGLYTYNIYEKETDTDVVGDSESLKTGICTVRGDALEYTEHEPDNAYTVR